MTARRTGGGNAAKHGTEEMVVPFVDERNADGSPGQLARCEESAETAANDHYARPSCAQD